MSADEASSPAPLWFSAESLLGSVVHKRYRVKAVIGAGGSGVLFAATDLRSGAAVALKLHRSGERFEDTTSRFVNEGDVAASLGLHPNIVRLLDWGKHEGKFPFLVFELLEGVTLEVERLARPMEPSKVLQLVLPIFGAVAYAHDRGVLHRDVKPQNIFLARGEGGQLLPKLLDFGIAKSHGGESLTRSGSIVGTPAFMSPEQALGEELDPRTDVWSMGVVLFACLTGQLPFAGDSHTRVLLELVSTPAPSLVEVRERLPPNLCAAIEKALERSRSRRYKDMREFAHALKEAAAIDGITVPADPDPVGLPEWSSWKVNAAPLRPDFELLPTEAGAAAHYRDCLMGIQRGPGGARFMDCAFDHARTMQVQYGKFALMIIVDSQSEALGTTELGQVLRFYDQCELSCVAQVVRTEGALGAVHRGVMSTINFVTRRSYPIKVFANSNEAARWIAEQCAQPGQSTAYAAGVREAVSRVDAAARALGR
ncbi:MAG: serine/threonine-protein kinase [Myxococcales bacterium]